MNDALSAAMIAWRYGDQDEARRAWLNERCRTGGAEDASEPRPATPRARSVVAAKTKKRVKCECGSCRRCLNRVWMRERRKRERAGNTEKRPPGKKTLLGRVCAKCGLTIWDRSVTGYCAQCEYLRRVRSKRVARRAPFFSHGGGI